MGDRMSYALTLLLIGFYAGVLAILWVKYLIARSVEYDDTPRLSIKKPRKIRNQKVAWKPSMRRGAA